MKIWCRILFVFCCVAAAFAASAQTRADVEAMQNLFPSPSVTPNFDTLLANTHGGEKLWAFAYVFYKKNLSTQDGPNCPFYPSCSRFSLDAIRKKGVLMGMLATFDRLNRCNGFHHTKYPKHPKYNLKLDVVE